MEELLSELVAHTNFNKDQLNQIQQSIDAGWQFRPSGANNTFVNKQFERNVSFERKDHILTHIADLLAYPYKQVSRVSIMPTHLNSKFVCLDFDIEDKHQNGLIWSILKTAYKDKLCIRKGGPNKLGQVYFTADTELDLFRADKVDVITEKTKKRCDAIGVYKDGVTSYSYPYLAVSALKPSELPVLTQNVVNELGIVLNAPNHGELISEMPSARHDWVYHFVFESIKLNKGLGDILEELRDTEQFQGIFQDRPSLAKKEIESIFRDIVGKTLFDIDTTKPEMPEIDFQDAYPECEPDSLIDILYQNSKRAAYTDAKNISFFTALSVASWMLTTGVVDEYGTTPNLAILYFANSGSGKSSVFSRMKNAVVKELPYLTHMFGSDTIETQQSFVDSFEHNPTQHFFLDEYSTLLESKGTSQNLKGLSERMFKYISDYPKQDIVYQKTKTLSYGFCSKPRFSLLAFATPNVDRTELLKDMHKGLARRAIVIFDDKNYKAKPCLNKGDFFTDDQKLFLRIFAKNYLYDIDSPVFYDTKDISNLKLVEKRDSKGNIVFKTEVLAPKTITTLKYSPEVKEFFDSPDGFVKRANELKDLAIRMGGGVAVHTATGFGEYTQTIAMIHSMAGKKDPSTTIEMDSIEYAMDSFNFHILAELSNTTSEFVSEENDSDSARFFAEKFKEKLIEDEIKTFKKSDSICKNFFRRKPKETKNSVLSILQSEKFLTSKGKTYAVNRGQA